MALDTNSLDSLRIQRLDPRAVSSSGRKLLYSGIAVAVAVAAGLAWFFLAPKTPEVTVVRAEAATGAPSAGNAVLNASGYVVARRMATVSSKVTGKVAEVLIEEGAEVEKDQLLARLDPSTTEALANMAAHELEAARRNFAEVEVRLAEAKRTLARNEQLVEQQLVSETTLDASRAEVNALTARLAAADAQRKVAASGLKLRQTDLADLEIRAPFAGVIVSKDAQPGEMISPVSAGGGFTRTGIATIVDMDSREVEVDVNEAYINRVKPNQRVEATLDAYPDTPLAAHVINIVPAADRTKATVRVRIGFEQLEPRILPDMGIKVRFLDDQPPRAADAGPSIRVPAAAVQREGGNAYVWVVSDDRVERRAVTVSPSNGDTLEVLGGIRSGETLVSPLVQGLQNGDKVKIKSS